MRKRLLSLSVLIVYSLLSFAQFSGSGSGTESDPYQITNAVQLSQVSNFLGQANVVFSLQNDLDLTEWIADNNPRQGWSPIGVSSSPFKGVFNGNGHTISGLSINRESETYVGFFGCLNGATIDDLTVKVKTVYGGTYVGGLAGNASTGCKITNCQVIQEGTLLSSDKNNIGGLIGKSDGNNVFTSCKFKGNLIGGSYVGGFIATISSGNATFKSCAVEGNITATGDYVGGFIGSSTGIGIEEMTECYYCGDIIGSSYVGGLLGAMLTTDEITPILYNYQVYCNTERYKQNHSTSDYGGNSYEYLSDKIVSGTTYSKVVNNCAVKGNIEGLTNVGGIVGYQNSGTMYSRKSYSYDKKYSWEGPKSYAYMKKPSTSSKWSWVTKSWGSISFTYYDYYKNFLTLQISNSSFAGSVKGTESVGGIIGYKSGGSILNSYAKAIIEGQDNVGGIVGKMSNEANNSVTTVKSNVAINDVVSATGTNTGRIYGAVNENYADIGAVGSNEGNHSLAVTKVLVNGAEKFVDDDLQNGTSVGASMLQMKGNYVAWGWDFSNNWNILDGESYPYKKYQAAPPIIDSELAYRATEISGRSADGGTIHLLYNGDVATTAEANGNTWSATTSPLKSESIVEAYVTVEGKMPSYTIVGGVPKVDYIVMDENSTFAPEASEGNVNVLLSRTMKAGEWSTIVLPFTTTGEQVKAAFGNDVELAAFTGWESYEDKNDAIVSIKVSFANADVEEGITANTPMLIKVKQAITAAIFEDVIINPEDEPVVQVGKKASERGYFYGTYVIKDIPEECVFLSNNQFWYSKGKSTTKGFRGYFNFRDVLDAYYDASNVKFSIFVDNTPLKINDIINNESTNGTLYDLSGRKVTNAQEKGIYIINGKKFIVK